jgi:hypothetical protein
VSASPPAARPGGAMRRVARAILIVVGLLAAALSWRTDGQPAPTKDNTGAVFLETEDRAPRPAFADAQCVDGTLRIRSIGHAPRDLPSRILNRVLGEGNYHPIEYQIFFSNIRENASLRVAAMLARPK